MKKTKKSKSNSIPQVPGMKGKKLSYEKLRTVVVDTIQASKNPNWTPRQLIKKLKIANSKSDLVRVLDGLVKQKKLSVNSEGIYMSLEIKNQSSSSAHPAKASGKQTYQGRVDMTKSGSAYV